MDFTFLTTVLTHNTILSGTLLFVLGAWFYFGRRTNKTREALSALLLYSALWLMAYSLQFNSEDLVSRTYWIRSLYVIAAFLPFFFYVLVDTIARGKPPIQKFQVLIATPGLAMFLVIYWSHLMLNRIHWKFSVGPAMIVFQGYYALMTAAAIAVMVTNHRKLKEKIGRSYYYLLMGVTTALGSLFSILYMLNMSPYQQQSWFGGLAAVTVLSGMLTAVYAIDSGDFMGRMKPVGLELFLLVVLLTLVINVVVSPGFISFSLRLAIMLCLILYGVAAVRSFSREVITLRDRERLHVDLEETNQRLVVSDRTKTRLLSFASHQLQAVVAGIKGYLDMLYKGDFGQLSEQQRTVAGVALVASERLGDTVETFLDVALVERGELLMHKKSVNAPAFVSHVVQEFAPMAEKKSISLSYDMSSQLGPIVCDEQRLYHAAANLIHNAINYTDKGGIMVTADQSEGRFWFRVQDTGIGLDDTSRRHVEDLFNRGLEAVRFESSSGSGLGLHVAKVIIDAHDGELFFRSEGVGKGSTFGFWIPLG